MAKDAKGHGSSKRTAADYARQDRMDRANKAPVGVGTYAAQAAREKAKGSPSLKMMREATERARAKPKGKR